MAITVLSFDNVQFVDFNPDPKAQPFNDLFLITGVVLIQPFTGTTGNQGGWTRDTCTFDVPTPDGQTFLFSGGDVNASAIVFPATVQNVGSQDIGFGVDSVSAIVSEPVNMQKQRKVTITAKVVVRDTKGAILRLGLQVNVLARTPIQ
jgi:hypothetical protein